MLVNGTILEDCDNCPIRNAELCHPSMCFDNDPPCSFAPDDMKASEWIKQKLEQNKRYEAIEKKRIVAERERKAKQELSKKRKQEAKWHVMQETRQINNLKKRIRANELILSRADSFAFATNMTNEMFGYSTRVKIQTNNPLSAEIEECKIQIKEIEAIKRQKLKELRNRRKDANP